MNLRDQIMKIKIGDIQAVEKILGDDREIILSLQNNWSLGTAVGEELIKLGLEITGVRSDNLSRIEVNRDGIITLKKEIKCHVICRMRTK